VVFIGLRGSGEPADPTEYNMGEVAFRTFEEFEPRARYEGIKVTPVGLTAAEYPAVPVFALMTEAAISATASSVEQGVAGLAKRVEPFFTSPSEASKCLVLVGYSQGAWVIGNYFDTFGPDVAARFSAVVLYGDPRFDPTADGVAQGSLEGSGVLRNALITPGPLELPAAGGYYENQSDQVRSFCHHGDPVCNFYLPNPCPPDVYSPLCPHYYYVPGFSPGLTGEGSQFLFDRTVPSSTSPPPEITGTSTYVEGVLVYLSVSFSDSDDNAEGFGFRGAKGSGWGEESHPFSDPSYGRVYPGGVDYPFNHACGTANQYESDVEFWIYDADGNRSQSVVVHLSCDGSA
jgi:hypothetical protein